MAINSLNKKRRNINYIKELQWESSNATDQWFSECVPWTNSLSITWELVRRQILGPQPDLLNQKAWERGPETCALTSPPWDSDGWWSVRSTAIANEHSSSCRMGPFQATATALSQAGTGVGTHAINHTIYCPSLLAHLQIPGHLP